MSKIFKKTALVPGAVFIDRYAENVILEAQ